MEVPFIWRLPAARDARCPGRAIL